MKSTFILGLLLELATANIIFKPVPLTCDPNADGPVQGLTGCLRGQVCIEGKDGGVYEHLRDQPA